MALTQKKAYTFNDHIKVNIYENFAINFQELDLD